MTELDEEQKRLAEELGIPLDSLGLEPNAADTTLLTPAHNSQRPVTVNLTRSNEVAKAGDLLRGNTEMANHMDELLLPMSVSGINSRIENDGLTPRRQTFM